ncbi:TetR family transcriptional regulator [Planomonospora parontospora subsp. parontospora]|uniref:TetR family transcriptional regulator n=2 Tax=Planomonospora parontospora TaxID=58119 RepID=A0AA37BNV3_9ACTN|nr:TetR/AcrR family transcriptional regulator C-terminal domain-containing protein [Planomonospora parontospora]GGK99925.1 TetR family transcriptional regulator [Planomonospora parontospora]GII13053.1 TetR family transcriptional regulator [Planomonospora parontospora subsp. parontospora]
MSVFAGQGDAERSMALLWGGPEAPRNRTGDARRAPGPKRALSVGAIVEAAIAVADEASTAEVSLRAVAERLGCTSMALYTYVPGKAELLDLMYDRAHAELPGRYDLSRGWRAAATSWAVELRSFYLRHPWVLRVSYARPVLGPHEQAVLESLAGVLFHTGLPAATLRAVVSALFGFVRGNAQAAAESRLAAAATGVSDQEWWAGRSALLARLAPDFAERFPMSVRLSAQDPAPAPVPARDDEPIPDSVPVCDDEPAPYVARQADEAFTVGLAVLLEGVEATRSRLLPPAAPSPEAP